MPILISAHHSTNVNFAQETISVEGVIERVRFLNPYVFVLIKNTDESGARTRLERQGVLLDLLRVESTVTATGRKGRS